MQRTDDADRAVDGNGTGRDAFTEGSPPSVPRTIVGEKFLNDVQEELVRSIELSGQTPRSGSTADPGGWEQLWAAIGRVCSPLSNWTKEPNGGTDEIRAIAYGADTFVSVGPAGKIYTLAEADSTASSATAPAWTSRTSGSAEYLYDIAWSGSLFVVVGSNGEILSSADGTTWAIETSGTAQNLYGVIWDGARFVVVGHNGTILTSPDGSTWTAQTSGTVARLDAIAHSGSLYVATQNGTGDVLTSANATTWASSTVNAGIDNLRCVRWVRDRFVVTGAEASPGTQAITATSLDGSTWTLGTPFDGVSTDIEDVVEVAGTLVLVAYDVRLGFDGLEWSAPRRAYRGIAGGRGCYAADRVLLPYDSGVTSSERLGL